jgi:uncharacterized protein (DUF427 family)
MHRAPLARTSAHGRFGCRTADAAGSGVVNRRRCADDHGLVTHNAEVAVVEVTKQGSRIWFAAKHRYARLTGAATEEVQQLPETDRVTRTDGLPSARKGVKVRDLVAGPVVALDVAAVVAALVMAALVAPVPVVAAPDVAPPVVGVSGPDGAAGVRTGVSGPLPVEESVALPHPASASTAVTSTAAWRHLLVLTRRLPAASSIRPAIGTHGRRRMFRDTPNRDQALTNLPSVRGWAEHAQGTMGKVTMQRQEPGPGQESVWDYPRPPACVLSDRLVVVALGDQIVAETRRAYRVLETSHPPTWYISPDDVRPGTIARSDARSTFCEWKGAATYFDVLGLQAAAWCYERPTRGFGAITGYLAFSPARLQCEVDGERVRPQDGGFYAGWITSDVVGPFKGGPGTLVW